jgi:hypothetical protein
MELPPFRRAPIVGLSGCVPSDPERGTCPCRADFAVPFARENRGSEEAWQGRLPCVLIREHENKVRFVVKDPTQQGGRQIAMNGIGRDRGRQLRLSLLFQDRSHTYTMSGC